MRKIIDRIDSSKIGRYQIGIILTILGGIFWGLSGASGEYLFKDKNIKADWLIPYRLLISGTILLIYAFIKYRKTFFMPFKSATHLGLIVFYGVVGLMLCQYTYFYAIELSNAAIPTVIQYTAPAFILLIVCVGDRRLPHYIELIALLLTIVGVFFLATHGQFEGLVISHKALILSFISTFSVVVYNIVPKVLNKHFPVLLSLAWGLIIGGILLSIYLKVWELNGIHDFTSLLACIGVILFGTIFAFGFYMIGVSIIGPSKASILAAIEPVSAAFFSYVLLGTKFLFVDYMGFFAILLGVFLLGKKRK